MNSTDDIKYRTIALLDKIEPYYILILVTVGLIGNSISFGIFLSSRLNKKESNIILASLGLVDNFFLITLVLVNLRHVGIDLFNKYSFVCKFTVYFTFICSFLSVWLVTLFSIERFIAVMFPLHRFSICNRKRNQLSIFVLVLFALVFYSFYFVTTGIETDSERTSSQCITYEKWVDMVKAISSVDIILTIVIPFIIILIINISISFKLTRFTLLYRHMRNKSLQRHQQQQFSNWPSPKPSRRSQNRGRRPTRAIPWCTMVTGRSSVSSAAPENEAAPLEETITSTRVTLPPSQPHSPLPVSSTNGALVPPSPKIILLVASSSPLHRQRSEKYSRTTRILLIISLTYILLNTLMAYSKLRHLFDEITHYSSDEDDEHLTAQEKRSKRLNNELLERISCYLYYLNFSINFFLYVLNKSTFRDILIGIFRRNNKSRISKV